MPRREHEAYLLDRCSVLIRLGLSSSKVSVHRLRLLVHTRQDRILTHALVVCWRLTLLSILLALRLLLLTLLGAELALWRNTAEAVVAVARVVGVVEGADGCAGGEGTERERGEAREGVAGHGEVEDEAMD